jgi:hypothetical protein
LLLSRSVSSSWRLPGAFTTSKGEGEVNSWISFSTSLNSEIVYKILHVAFQECYSAYWLHQSSRVLPTIRGFVQFSKKELFLCLSTISRNYAGGVNVHLSLWRNVTEERWYPPTFRPPLSSQRTPR